jgi:hypothetical protein
MEHKISSPLLALKMRPPAAAFKAAFEDLICDLD